MPLEQLEGQPVVVVRPINPGAAEVTGFCPATDFEESKDGVRHDSDIRRNLEAQRDG